MVEPSNAERSTLQMVKDKNMTAFDIAKAKRWKKDPKSLKFTYKDYTELKKLGNGASVPQHHLAVIVYLQYSILLIIGCF